MNLRRHLSILWRFRFIVAGGVVLGIALGVLALFQVNSNGLAWRAEQTWESRSTLYVTQPGFPDGRVVLGTGTPGVPEEQQPNKGEQFADPSRFANLAVVYSSFIQSDRVRAMMKPTPAPGQITMNPVPAAMNSTQTLPIVTLSTNAKDPATAKQLNASAIEALNAFLQDEQERNKISPDNRVRVEVLNPPSKAGILIGRSKTPGIVAFILCVSGALALAYCLDNLRPRWTVSPDDEFLEFDTVDEQGENAAALSSAWPPASHSGVEPSRRAG
jgi:hypothetical protein